MALAVFFFGASPSIAHAEEPQELPDLFYMMQNPKRLLRGAAMSESQVAQLLVLRKANWQRERELIAERDALWRRFEELYVSAEPNPSELDAIDERAMAADREIEMIRYRMMLKMRSLLTPEQLKRVSESYKKLRELEAQKRGLEPTVAAERGK
jgi:Spy/CpxP family protein refolding chaperone